MEPAACCGYAFFGVGCEYGDVFGLYAHLDKQADVQFMLAHGVEAVELFGETGVDAVEQE